ncbi:MAG TPA: response regulator transcription factor [Limnobacter sp.]|nr:response regulator transcription factor [Limnobacter sp.]
MSSSLNILVIEDNEQLREEMVAFLSRPGWIAHGVDCGESMDEWLSDHTPDVVILDVNLPYEDGYSIARRLRNVHTQVGIVMLTARVRPTDRTTGYEAGVDVYLTKPTHTAELVAVIENLGRRLRREISSSYALNRQSLCLIGPTGQRCALTITEANVLELLALASGKDVEIDYLLDRLGSHDGKSVTRESLAVTISRLRQKCKLGLSVDNMVIANRGVGYRLALPVELR